jgi:hypothetical protein
LNSLIIIDYLFNYDINILYDEVWELISALHKNSGLGDSSQITSAFPRSIYIKSGAPDQFPLYKWAINDSIYAWYSVNEGFHW